MPVISVNISDKADRKLTRAAKAMRLSKSKLFNTLVLEMDAFFGPVVSARIEEIADLQERARALLHAE